jgi:hypothetical protein
VSPNEVDGPAYGNRDEQLAANGGAKLSPPQVVCALLFWAQARCTRLGATALRRAVVQILQHGSVSHRVCALLGCRSLAVRLVFL